MTDRVSPESGMRFCHSGLFHVQINGNADVYGTMIDTAGSVLNPNGIDITDATGYQYSPKVAFNGTTFLVVWYDDRNFGTTAYDIYGARVGIDGSVLTTPGTDLAIDTNANYQYYPTVATVGSQFLVAWEDSRNFGTTNWDIWGTRVDSSGVITDGVTTGFMIDQAANDQFDPALASTGSEYLVVWDDYRNGTDYNIWGNQGDDRGHAQWSGDRPDQCGSYRLRPDAPDARLDRQRVPRRLAGRVLRRVLLRGRLGVQ